MEKKSYKKSIFIFRRDFRLDDNMGLLQALQESQTVMPIFIFTPEQVVKNRYKSENAIQFMGESLQQLDKDLKKKNAKLFYFFGRQHQVIEDIIKKNEIDAVFVNRDYTPYAKKRDKSIEKVCKKHGVIFTSSQDYLLHPVGSVLTGSGEPYKVYTPYFKKARRVKVKTPVKNKHRHYTSKYTQLASEYDFDIKKQDFYKENKEIAVRGGRGNALAILKKIENFKDYDKKRNMLTYDTTRLSAYIKFGCVSIREVYYAFKKAKLAGLIRQLYWREFYYNIAHSFEHVFGHAMKEKYDKIKWPDKKTFLQKWQKGETGFPIVDACMRELNATGFMHNRGRLITSNLLIKILLVDWRNGEQYFANKLVDYDPAVNNGNWQWSASTGADSQPYFRIFNPWLQSKKFDPKCEYIKKWLPELQQVKAGDIHKWDKKYKKYPDVAYSKPMVDYALARKKAPALYKKYLKS